MSPPKQQPLVKLAPIFLRQKRHDRLTTLPTELLMMIIKELTPGCLLAISKASKRLRGLVWNAAAEQIWVDARVRQGWPNPSSRTHEAHYANLIEGYKCSYCLEERRSGVFGRHFELGLALCTKCTYRLMKTEEQLGSYTLHPDALQCCVPVKDFFDDSPSRYFLPEVCEMSGKLFLEQASQMRKGALLEHADDTLPAPLLTRQRVSKIRSARRKGEALRANFNRLMEARKDMREKRWEYCKRQLAELGFDNEQDLVTVRGSAPCECRHEPFDPSWHHDTYEEEHARCMWLPLEHSWVGDVDYELYSDRDTTGYPVDEEWRRLGRAYIKEAEYGRKRRLAAEKHERRLVREAELAPLYDEVCLPSDGPELSISRYDFQHRLGSVVRLHAGREPLWVHLEDGALLEDIKLEAERWILHDEMLIFHRLCLTLRSDGVALPTRIARMLEQEPSPFVDCDRANGLAPLHAQIDADEYTSIATRLDSLHICGACRMLVPLYEIVEHCTLHDKLSSATRYAHAAPIETRRALRRLESSLAARGITKPLDHVVKGDIKFDLTYLDQRTGAQGTESAYTWRDMLSLVFMGKVRSVYGRREDRIITDITICGS